MYLKPASIKTKKGRKVKLDEKNKILVVDDEEIFHEQVNFAFPDYELVNVSTIEQARTLLQQKRFNLILLDLNFNGRYEGLEFVSYVKKWIKTPVIVITNSRELKHAHKAGKNGAEAYIYKKEYELKKWKNLIAAAIDENKTSENAYTKIKKHLEQGDVKSAIKLNYDAFKENGSSKSSNTALVLLSKFSNNENDDINDIIERKTYELRRSKLTNKLLKFIDQIENKEILENLYP